MNAKLLFPFTFLLSAVSAQAALELKSVSFDSTNGASPAYSLAKGIDGNFYAVTASGGYYWVYYPPNQYVQTPARGVFFRFTTNATLTPLYTLGASTSDGSVSGSLAQRKYDGKLYGIGGSSEWSLFKAGTNETVQFTKTTVSTNVGMNPRGTLLEGPDGNFYGTASGGGTNGGYGTIYKITFNGRVTLLHSFAGEPDGANPIGLTLGNDQNLYGVARFGGANNSGTVFRLTTSGTFTTLYSFTGTEDGAYPSGALTLASDGWFYGTTEQGGTNSVWFGGNGTVFKVDTNGLVITLASFDGTNGATPMAGLLQGIDGHFYGTTASGGVGFNGGPSGYGTVFRYLTNGAISTLVSFGETNGARPQAALVQDSGGSFYGCTYNGGDYNKGTVFQLRETQAPKPVLQAPQQSGSNILLSWSAVAGTSYQVEYKTNWQQINWLPLGSNITATSSMGIAIDACPAPQCQRYYRVLVR